MDCLMFENAMEIPPAEFDVRYVEGKAIGEVLSEFRRRERTHAAGNPGWEYADEAFGGRYNAAVIAPDAEPFRSEAQDFTAAAEHAVGNGDAAVRMDVFDRSAERCFLDNEYGQTA